MALVTLIGEKIAKEGNEFIYMGPNNECRNCKLKTVCFNLKTGRHYKITNVREKRHSCNVHDGNAAVVEVQELPLQAIIDKKIKEGSSEKIELKECRSIGCQYYDLCINNGIQKDKKYNVTKVIEIVDCPLGYNLHKVELSDE